MTEPAAPDGPGGQRLDKWLWCARFFKSRTLATRAVQERRVRVDGAGTDKPHFRVRPGHVLTFVAGGHVRIVRVMSLADRRGPAAEAQCLYEDLSPPAETTRLPRDDGGQPPRGRRPTKRERRQVARLREPEE